MMTNIDLKNIIISCANGLLIYFNLLKDEKTLNLVKNRLTRCKSCKVYNNGRCDSSIKDKVAVDFMYMNIPRRVGEEYTGCGCFINCKATRIDNQCPLGKWENI